MSNKIEICLACDKNYLHYLYITINSILKSSDNDDEFNMYVLQSDFTQKEKNILNQLQKIKSFNLEFLDVDESLLLNCRRDGDRLPLQAYYRFLIADLKPELEKVLYLDPDIEVKKSLRPLWNKDVNDYYIAAGIDPISNKGIEHKIEIGLNKDENYYNAGVLLINLNLFKKEKIKDKLIKAAIENKKIFPLGDQDALNHVCKGKIHCLEKTYNFRATKVLSIYEDLDNIENAVIKHYIGRDKCLFKLLKYLDNYPLKLKINAILKYILAYIKHYFTYKFMFKKFILLLKSNEFLYVRCRSFYRAFIKGKR